MAECGYSAGDEIAAGTGSGFYAVCGAVGGGYYFPHAKSVDMRPGSGIIR
jgi:uncharacterized protein YcfJ